MAYGRTRHACALLDNWIYVIGGGVEILDTEILDLGTNTWSYGPQLPKYFFGKAITFKDTIYAININLNVFKLNDDKNGWIEVSPNDNYNYYYSLIPPLVVDEDILNC